MPAVPESYAGKVTKADFQAVAVELNATRVATDQAQATASAAAGTTVSHVYKTASYTLDLADAGKVVDFNTTVATVLTLSTNSMPPGTVVGVRQYGSGQVSIAAGASVTIRSRGGALNMAGQYAEASLTKRKAAPDADEWILTGDLAV